MVKCFMKERCGQPIPETSTPERKMSNVKLAEIYSIGNGSQKTYSIRQVYINSDHVVCMREDVALKNVLAEGRLVDGLDKRQDFTRITLSNNSMQQEILVIGAIDEIYNKFHAETKNLLRG